MRLAKPLPTWQPASPPRRLRKRGLRFARAVAWSVGLLFGCGPSGTETLPESFLGRWYYVGSSGGLSGDGLGDEATGYLVIEAENTMASFSEDGTLLDRTEFTAARGPTIFSTDDQWVLTFADTQPEVVITVSDDGGEMALSDNVYDGFQHAYARRR